MSKKKKKIKDGARGLGHCHLVQCRRVSRTETSMCSILYTLLSCAYVRAETLFFNSMSWPLRVNDVYRNGQNPPPPPPPKKKKKKKKEKKKKTRINTKTPFIFFVKDTFSHRQSIKTLPLDNNKTQPSLGWQKSIHRSSPPWLLRS